MYIYPLFQDQLNAKQQNESCRIFSSEGDYLPMLKKITLSHTTPSLGGITMIRWMRIRCGVLGFCRMKHFGISCQKSVAPFPFNDLRDVTKMYGQFLGRDFNPLDILLLLRTGRLEFSFCIPPYYSYGSAAPTQLARPSE